MADLAVNNIRLKTFGWISASLGAAKARNQTLKIQVKAEATVQDLLMELAGLYTEFRDRVYNAEAGTFKSEILVIVNDRLIQNKDFRATILKDKDQVTLSPMLVGG